MAKAEVDVIGTALRKRWSSAPSVKANGYVGKFVDATRTGEKITAQVEGNHGRYTATTLDALLQELTARGVTQKAFAESIGMNPRHLGSIKSSELRNRFYNELGATKVACLWALEHVPKKKR